MNAMQSIAAIFAATFTDPDPTPGSSVVRAADIMELRSAVNKLRAQNFGLASFSFTDPTILAGTTVVEAAHFTELRTAVGDASVQAGVTPSNYTDSMLTPHVTVIRAVDLNELHIAVRRLE